MNDKPIVCVIDKDAAVCDSLSSLLGGLGVELRFFKRADEFLSAAFNTSIRCLITELHLPDMSGIELLEELRKRGINIPTIVLASVSDVPTAVRTMRAGAVDFIDKPIVDQHLLKQVRQILSQANLICKCVFVRINRNAARDNYEWYDGCW